MGMAWQVWIRHGRTVLSQMGKTRSKPLAVQHGRGMGKACYVWIGLYGTNNSEMALTLLENLWNPCFQLLTCIWKPLYNLRHSRSLLTYGNINTVQLLLLIFSIIEPFLVDNCVNGKSSFTTRQKWQNLITSKLNTPKDSLSREDKFPGKSANGSVSMWTYKIGNSIRRIGNIISED